MRRTTDSEDRNEASTPRGSSVGTKRTRREGVRREALDPSGQRTIMVQLTPEEQGGFMDRIRVSCYLPVVFGRLRLHELFCR